MMRYILFIMIPVLLTNCGDGRYSTPTTTTDSTATAIDTLVSDVSWEEDLGDEEYDYEEEEETTYSSNRSSNSYTAPSSNRSSSSGGRAAGGAADNDADVVKYQNYERAGNSPKDFATALIYPAIRMVYSDNFAKPRVTVTNSDKDGERHNIDLSITWKDHWVPKYRIDGTLTVNADGSDATFVITDKNVNAEVLELTEDTFESELRLPNL